MTTPAQKNRKTVLMVAAAVVFMLGLTALSVPLYDLFCRATGFGGTTQRVEENTGPVLAREMEVQFNADVARNLNWDFRPRQRSVRVKIGEDRLVRYEAKNLSDQPLVGTAVFNVTPPKAGKYFNKTECFCFTEQLLKPGESAEFPVSFFIDPEIVDDPNLDDVKTVTLSYTFFKADSEALEEATETFYND